ncbi:MAG: A/G-specific adenine glycosylase [Alphaproteobacteria bacterium]|nr:A/G-specific adenine glycosylase [Alphaproteobacteria bacterium]
MSEISKSLLKWYYRNARTLPWRVIKKQHPNPYHVWVSEIMLQQTTVQTVIPYFDRFLETFPTAESLANAEENAVLNLWQGLGYYSRARNLHAGAKQILNLGKFPNTFQDLQNIKGVGRYTASAIASIAFSEKVPVVDGNVKRVFARLFCLTEIGKKLEDKVFTLSKKEMPETSAGDYNSAVMDLGATICSPTSPLCEECPIQKSCQSYQKFCVDKFPIKEEKKKIPERYGIVFLCEKKEKILIRKREEGILKGLYELPWNEVEKKDFENIESKIVKHAFTHFHLYLKIQKSGKEENGIWVAKEKLSNYPISTLFQKVLQTCVLS